tara:strand:- start:614 stop:1192 length:579 start_codon:yes stop_codon:yes gene_type:complete
MLKLDGKTLQYDRAFTHNQISYPANWLRLTTLEEKQAIGITEVADTSQSWDQRFYWNVDNPKDLDQLKTNWKQQQSDIAGTLLAPSDWRVIKARETGGQVNIDWFNYRKAVRSACNTRQTEIDAVTTVKALKELLFGEPTVTQQKKDSEGNGVVEPDTITVDGKEEANPFAGQPVMETVANPAIATAWPTPI